MSDVVQFVALVVFLVGFLGLVWWADFGPPKRRRRPPAAPVVEDLADDVVTWEQVAGTLPAGVVDEVRRAVEGRPPVLQPERRRYERGGRVIVYPVNGEPYELAPDGTRTVTR